MNSQISILTDAELEQVIGGVNRPFFRTVLDMSAASQVVSRTPSASVGEMKPITLGHPVF